MSDAHPIVFDTDPGHDDAIALLLAAAADELSVEAVTTVHGNQTLEKTTRNALQVLEVADRTDIPVAAGMEGPMVREQIVAPAVHGESGLDGPQIPEPTAETVGDHGVDRLIETVRAHESVTLVPVGPLTNVGMAIKKAPDLLDHVDEIVLMGGAVELGNRTPSAEFNVLADPEAAGIVFDAPVPVTMVGLGATHEVFLPADRFNEVRKLGSPVATLVADLFEFYADSFLDRYEKDGVVVHDALAVAEVVHPGILETEPMAVTVDTDGEHTYGRTVCDVNDVTDAEANAEVAVGADDEAFFEFLFDGIAAYS